MPAMALGLLQLLLSGTTDVDADGATSAGAGAVPAGARAVVSESGVRMEHRRMEQPLDEVHVPSNQPTLDWQPRSDWLNVRTGCNGTAGAKGDGKTDDTAAIQACMDQFGDGGATLYLPPGSYKITQSLTMGCKNATGEDSKGNPKIKGCLVGGSIIGHGATTTILWGGAANGTMLLDTGVTGFRFMGVHWDGGGIAWYGVAHQSIKMFETECHHEAEAFSNFAYAGIGIDRYRLQSPNHVDGATAETYFRNCIFEDSAIGVLWNNFNDLDNHFDGCLFRNMLMGVYGIEGTVYMMNSRFENSSAVDISRDAAEWNHDTLRNVISVGSNMFVRSDAALSLYDCHVYGWVGDTNKGKDFKKLAEGSYTPCSCDIYSKECHRPRGDCPNIYWRNGAAMAVLGQMQIHDSTFTNAQCNRSVAPDPPPGTNQVQGQHHGNSTGVICCVLDGWDFDTHTNDDPVLIVNSSLGPPATGYPLPEWTCKHEIPTNGHDTEILEHGSLLGTIYLGDTIAGEPALGPNVTVLDLPAGDCPATGIGAATNFHKDTWEIPTTVIEISKYGPFPSKNKSLDATDAVQQTIDAAAKAGGGAVAYFPPGFYYISKPITVSGTDFWISGGNSLATVFQWRGDSEPSAAMITVAAGSQVHLEEFSLRILNSTDSVSKILVTGTGGTVFQGSSTAGSTACTNVSVNRLNVGGYGSKSHTGTSGLRIVNLAKCDIVNVHHMDGDMHAKNNDGVVLTGFQTAGGLVLEGSSEGFFGQRVRFTCCTHDYTTKLIGPQTYACAAYYQESAPNIFGATASAGSDGEIGAGASDRAGNVAVNAIKLSATDWLNSDFEQWTGNFFQTGGWATTQGAKLENKTSLNMTVRADGAANLTYTLAFPWDLTYTFEMSGGAQLTEIGTRQHDDTGMKHTIPDQEWKGSASTIARGYDLLRRLGRVDLQHNYPALGIKDVCAAGSNVQQHL